jgi:hypothetical protein
MKIEVDTKHDSREELAHLAEMLQKLARSSGSGVVTTESKTANIFEDPAPSGGLFNMFDDSPSTPTTTPATSTMSAAEPAPSQPAQNEPASGGLFSLFSDDPKPDSPSVPSTPSPSMVTSAEATVAELLSGQAQAEEEEIKESTSAKEVFDGDDIVPY